MFQWKDVVVEEVTVKKASTMTERGASSTPQGSPSAKKAPCAIGNGAVKKRSAPLAILDAPPVVPPHVDRPKKRKTVSSPAPEPMETATPEPAESATPKAPESSADVSSVRKTAKADWVFLRRGLS